MFNLLCSDYFQVWTVSFPVCEWSSNGTLTETSALNSSVYVLRCSLTLLQLKSFREPRLKPKFLWLPVNETELLICKNDTFWCLFVLKYHFQQRQCFYWCFNFTLIICTFILSSLEAFCNVIWLEAWETFSFNYPLQALTIVASKILIGYWIGVIQFGLS